MGLSLLFVSLQSHWRRDQWLTDSCANPVIAFFSSEKLVHYIRKNELNPYSFNCLLVQCWLPPPSSMIELWFYLGCCCMKLNPCFCILSESSSCLSGWWYICRRSLWKNYVFLGKGMNVPDKVFPPFPYFPPLNADMMSGSPAANCSPWNGKHKATVKRFTEMLTSPSFWTTHVFSMTLPHLLRESNMFIESK